jgi:hypothetical protein
MTTAGIAKDSIPALIAAGENPDTVINILKMQGSFKSKDLQADYDTVMTMPSPQLQMLVERLVVHANLPGISGITEELKRRLRRHGFHERTLDIATQRLHGWLWGAVVAGLDGPSGKSHVLITEAQFHAAQCQIRDELTAGSLPVRYMDSKISDFDFAGQKDRRYMRQLDLIGADSTTKLRSVSAFFRASSERAEWTERSEVLPDELSRYDQELTERWQVEFSAMCTELRHMRDDAEHQSCCQRLFHDIERLDIPIRQGWLHRYLTTGSYHILADNLAVGWHPRYTEMLGEEASGGHLTEDI